MKIPKCTKTVTGKHSWEGGFTRMLNKRDDAGREIIGEQVGFWIDR